MYNRWLKKDICINILIIFYVCERLCVHIKTRMLGSLPFYQQSKWLSERALWAFVKRERLRPGSVPVCRRCGAGRVVWHVFGMFRNDQVRPWLVHYRKNTKLVYTCIHLSTLVRACGRWCTTCGHLWALVWALVVKYFGRKPSFQ